ncbi:MAG: hypothetical protein JSU86_04745 [Phycisphaerales bacterium]|nr:MAG: hypothetical protein JSU86_04745 [Phycisphaerales bacterium]
MRLRRQSVAREDCGKLGCFADIAEPISGGQFFLAYDPSLSEVVEIRAGDAPFSLLLFSNAQVPDLVDCAVGVSPLDHPGTSENRVMARIILRASDVADQPQLWFRPQDEPSTVLLTADGGVRPYKVDGVAARADVSDFAAFQSCYGGSERPVPVVCRCRFDLDNDEDVDTDDFQLFRASFSGPPSGVCTSD